MAVKRFKMDNHLRVAFATDDGYIAMTGIAMYSLFDNNQEFEYITVYILDNCISEEGKDQLREIATYFRRQIEFLDCSSIGEWLGNEVMEMFRNENTNVPVTSYSRLFLSELLNEDIDKILYLDADSIILGSYVDLWNKNIDEYAVLGVLDNVNCDARIRVGLPENFGYINAGVLLMNLAYLRKINFVARVRNFIKKYQGRVFHHDQGIINGVLNERIGILPVQYNMLSFLFEQNSVKKIIEMYDIPIFYSEQEYRLAKENPIFIHFTEGYLQRPWVKKSKHPLKAKWMEYRSKTIWKSEKLQEDKRSNKLRILAWMNLNLPIKLTKILIALFRNE